MVRRTATAASFQPTAGARTAPVAGELRRAMGHFATGVSVVTSSDRFGQPIGSTANALTSVSLEPPLVLVCMREQSDTLAALRHSGRFAINLLAHDQRALAERFASRSSPDTWLGVDRRDGPHGVPLIAGALATVTCTLHDVADGGDHRVVIGRVLAVEHPEEHVAPLLFYRGAYAQLHPPHEALRTPAARTAVAQTAVAQARAQAPRGRPPLGGDVFLPTPDGSIRLVPVDPGGTPTTSVIALVGEPRDSAGALVYLHRGCLLGDALGNLECRRRSNLELALARIREHGTGIAVYHRDDSSPFAGCCTQTPPSSRAASDPLATGLREALAQLRLRDVRLLRFESEPHPLPAAGLELDVAAVESLDAANRLRGCGSSQS